ncbi:uncharacterized protein TNCV_3136581 [Trichonephila clavipes]|nr:uncharacterized protein TNCV_3136581 [Trichonephila clavipes]
MMWKKKIIWSSGVIGSSYIIWSYKSAIPHLESTYHDQRSHEKENASYILLPKKFGGNFYVDVGSSWLPYIPNSYNRYWNLLMLAKSEKQSVRHRAVKSLSQLSNLDSWQYMMIAQTSDLRTAVGLARSSNVSASFFLSPPFKKLEKDNSREELLQLLLSLSVLDADKCIQLLAKRVEAVAYQLFKMKEGWNSELEDSCEIYHSERKKKASFIFDKLCLQVLLGYSSMKSHRSLMFEKGVLKVLYSVSKLYEDNREFQSMIAQILANLALEDMYAKDFHITARKTTVRLLNVPQQTVSDAICRFKDLGNNGRRPGSGRKRTVNTSRNRKTIEKRVQRNTRASMRQFVRDIGISDRSVRRIAKTELGLKPYKLRDAQLLSKKNKLVRLRRCRKLLRRTASQCLERFLVTDEKGFTVLQVHNSQNDRILCVDAPSTSAIVEHR